jgi:hypothetical protein
MVAMLWHHVRLKQNSVPQEVTMVVPDDVRKAMQETNDRFCREVVGGGQFDALDLVYTTAARILPPGAPMMEGREAIKAFWKAGWSQWVDATLNSNPHFIENKI